MSELFKQLPVALDAGYLFPNLNSDMVKSRTSLINVVDSDLRNAKCQGADFTGWIVPDAIVSSDEFARIKNCAKRLSDETDILLVIGIGGSYLGARAVIEALADNPEKVIYAGQNISAHYMANLKKKLAGKRVAINVVSKSGTTTEPAVAFRILKELVPADKTSSWIVATTDEKKGALLQLARKEGYETFVVPDNVGGRFSVFSAVGLLPIAYAGIDIDSLINGASKSAELTKNTDPITNPAYYYAAARNILYAQGFSVEIMSNFEPRLHYFSEWWKQLFGESEGKENIGLYPASCDFTTDLHSMGQYVQEGRRNLIETFLIVSDGEPSMLVPKWDENSDGMNYLAGKEISYVNMQAYKATAKAHREGSVPNMTILIERLDAYSIGALMYFFEIACGITCLLQGVNPFNQPGVEAYKKHMFELLGKPGFESGDKEIKNEFITFS